MILIYIPCQKRFRQIKNAPDRIYALSRTNRYWYSTTLSAVPPRFTAWPVHLSGYKHIPGIYTPAFSVAEYSVKITFDCALSGPFDNLFPAWFSASQALCMGMIAVISASTVWSIKFLLLYHCCMCVSIDFIKKMEKKFGGGIWRFPEDSFRMRQRLFR